MTTHLDLRFERIDGAFDDPLEQATFARLWVTLGDRILSRCADRRTVRDYVKLPLHQLALGLATHWWTLLYEPWRPDGATPWGSASHRLDAFTLGYVFPAVGVWSAGTEALTVETNPGWQFSEAPRRELLPEELAIAARIERTPPVSLRSLSRVAFTDETHKRLTVSRKELESRLFDIVSDVAQWTHGLDSDRDLLDRWSRVVGSMNDAAERNYCIASGQLGFDPYSPDSPDISMFAAQLPGDSFDDLCDAVRFDELPDASAWVSKQQDLLESARPIDLKGFGRRPELDPTKPAWESGYRAAIELRRNLSLEQDPLQATRRLIGEAPQFYPCDTAPPAVEGLLVRQQDCVRSRVQARSDSQWRFRECRAAYLGWGAEPDNYPLLTTAATHRQQASRAFAAELLCPAEYLRDKAGNHGLTPDQVSEIATGLQCSIVVVEHQARNHEVALRGLY